jgi:hypothetical protein
MPPSVPTFNYSITHEGKWPAPRVAGGQQLVGSGVLPAGYATDDGVGIVYHGTEFAEAVSEVSGKGAYRVTPDQAGTAAVEERIEPRVLPGAL